MLSYLEHQFDFSDDNLVSVYDELPLWSSCFANKLLDKIVFKPNINILDIGCGTGFPLIEIAQRFGNSSFVYGIDPWKKAVDRANFKIRTMQIDNIKVIEGMAEQLPFDDGFFSLIVSNNGINNVNDPEKVLSECARVCKKNGQFVFTVNLPDTMIEFYYVFEEVLKENSLKNEAEKMKAHILAKRKTVEKNIDMILQAGFSIKGNAEDKFYLRFYNGSAMLNHHFIKLAFLDSWKNIIPAELRESIFMQIEGRLNLKSVREGRLSLTIPYVCFDCRKN